MNHLLIAAAMTAIAAPAAAQAQPPQAAMTVEALEPRIAALFEEHAREQNMPGLVWGVVKDSRLVLVRGLGVQDRDTRAPVTPDSLFRIASMSKAITALAILDLRDRGLVSLEAPAEDYIPEMKGWRYPTTDSPKIRVRDLLHHNAGFVDDNPWGDRQQSLSEEDWSAMLAAGVPFARVPQTAYEYSNFGYAALGRIVTNVSKMPYQRYIAQRIFRPLGMEDSGYDVFASPAEQRALGYRFEEGRFRREADMADGTFGAMGGVETSANDYARYVAWILSAWPPRDGAERGPMKRASVRELVQGSGFQVVRPRRVGGDCPAMMTYGMGFQVIEDCDLSYMTHTGGYPGYGSVVMLVPEAGIGIFAFSNRTYGAPVPPAYQAMRLMKEAGLLDAPRVLPTERLRAGYDAVAAIWRRGDVLAQREALAMNFLLDRPAELWRADLARMKSQLGECATGAAVEPVTMLAGRFTWECDRGSVTGSVLMAPTDAPTIQEIRFVPRPR